MIVNALLFVFTLIAYGSALWLYRKSRLAILHPLITSAGAIIILLYGFGIQYEQYARATQAINFMLGPSVVALGYALYVQIDHLKANLVSILTSVLVGSVVGIASVWGILRLFQAPGAVEASLLAKAVTTPIAIQISERSGGIPSLTAVIVIMTGILGSIIAPSILRRLGVTSAIARGLALGCSSHGVGTAKAMELGALEGAISGLAIGLMGLMTAILVSIFNAI